MKTSLMLSTFLLLVSMSSFAQKNVIITIGDKKFTTEEFERIYHKNNTQLNDESDVKTPEEYVSMFTNYKLKVIEAEKRGLDTTKAFVDELAGYRDELAKPYLTDVSMNDSMVKVAYYRTINEIKASHILIKTPNSENTSPEDTLKFYNKLIEIRNQYLNKEKTFEELALEYSQDESVTQNKGSLGYFNAFKMIAPFENAAYSTPVGQISMPFRTSFGYHIVLVHDIKPSIGEVKVAHIMKMVSSTKNVSPEEDQRLKNQIDSIYSLVKNGADFGVVARELSDDKATGRKNGEMPFIAQTFYAKEFADAAFALKNDGDISEPIRTAFGWHILKRIERKAPPTFDEIKSELAEKIRKDEYRSQYAQNSYLEKLKKINGFKGYNENIDEFKNYLKSFANDTIDKDFPKNILELPLYQVANETYRVADFWNLQQIKKQNDSKFITPMVLKHLDLYENELILGYEKSQLEKKYPEFGQIVQEYRDGMLLFSIMEQEVWNKAAQDTIGFNAFYEKNKGKYTWGKHFDGLLFRCYNQAAKDSVDKLIALGITDPDSIKSRVNVDKQVGVKITKNKWEKGQNDRIDYLVFEGPEPERFIKGFEFILGNVIENGVKTLDESRGLYLSDYQQELEKQWLEALNAKYKVTVNQKLIKKIQGL